MAQKQTQFSVIFPDDVLAEIDAYRRKKEEQDRISCSRNQVVLALVRQALGHIQAGGKKR
jgi:metal-responsive CopG/Arc/MetJ family transcriptional regulator